MSKRMLDKKKEKGDKTSEQEALEKQIDAMMDPKIPDDTGSDVVSKPAPGTAGPSVVNDSKTAPQLPEKLRKQLGVEVKPTTKPITIEKLDEITERIVGPKAEKPKPKPADKPEDIATDNSKKPEPDGDVVMPSTNLDDVRTDAAVDDIVAYEGDVMLAIADSTASERNRRAQAEAGNDRKKGGFSAFLWFLVFAVAVIALILLGMLLTGGNVNRLKF